MGYTQLPAPDIELADSLQWVIPRIIYVRVGFKGRIWDTGDWWRFLDSKEKITFSLKAIPEKNKLKDLEWWEYSLTGCFILLSDTLKYEWHEITTKEPILPGWEQNSDPILPRQEAVYVHEGFRFQLYFEYNYEDGELGGPEPTGWNLDIGEPLFTKPPKWLEGDSCYCPSYLNATCKVEFDKPVKLQITGHPSPKVGFPGETFPPDHHLYAGE